MESMGVVSRWRVWVESPGVVRVMVVRRYIDFVI